MIYLDTCAAVKLARLEPASQALVTWLRRRQAQPLVASVLIEIELERALRRNAPEALHRLPGILERLNRLEIDASIRAAAGAYQDPLLRSLDAIHLATAQAVHGSGAGLSAFVTYDKRLAAAARATGLTVAHPGAPG